MGERTGIGWTHHTFSPWWGCVKISPGCLWCYADELAAKLGRDCWGPTRPRQIARDAYWELPLRWNRAAERAGERRRVFPSMCDPFEGPDVPAIMPDGRLTTLAEPFARLCNLIEVTPWLDWLLLTKRPENMIGMLPVRLAGARNIWPGTSIELGDYLVRARDLLRVPAPVHFLSLEPLLGPLNVTPFLHDVEWVIVGGESKVRPATLPVAVLQRIEERSLVERRGKWTPKPDAVRWVRSLRDQVLGAGVPFFFKQWGGPRYYSGGQQLDGRTWTEVPAALRL